MGRYGGWVTCGERTVEKKGSTELTREGSRECGAKVGEGDERIATGI